MGGVFLLLLVFFTFWGLLFSAISCKKTSAPGSEGGTIQAAIVESYLKTKPEDCKPFADATYLPEADSFKVGRLLIDDYKSYKLNIKYSVPLK
jgi:hypothetical protein